MPSRRRFLAGTAATSSVALAGCTGLPFVGGGGSVPLGDDFPKPADNPVQSGWPSFRRDAANTGCVPAADPVEDPSVQWESPRITHPHRVLWRTVTVDAATVYAGGEALHGLDVVSGDRVWTQPGGFATRTAPDLHDGVAWLRAGEDGTGVVGVDGTSGELTKRRELPVVPDKHPRVTAGEPYLVAPGGGAVAGRALHPDQSPEYLPTTWSRDLFATSTFRPATTREVAVVSYTGEVYRFSAWGTPVWRQNLHRRPRTQPVVGEKRIYVGTGNGVVALDRGRGAVVWEFDGANSVRRSGVAFDGARVVVADESALHAISAKTGESLWRYDFDITVTSLPTIGGDRVYVCTRTAVHALTLDGSHEWTLDLENPVGSSLALADGTLYTIVNRGNENDVAVLALA